MSSPDPGNKRTVPEVFQGASERLAREVEAYLRTFQKPETYPDKLFHFTSCTGLIGILGGRTLWASLATSLNDSSETKIGDELLRWSGRMAVARSRHLHYQEIEDDIKQHQEAGTLREVRAYVVSFCVDAEAFHWRHYGRGGTGVCVLFNPESLATIRQFVLVPVVYEVDQQIAIIRGLVERVDSFLDETLPQVDSEWQHRLKVVAAALLSSYVRLVAPQMKDYPFRGEREWRLFSTETPSTPNDKDDKTRETKFRATSDRIVPFKEVEFAPTAIDSILLGYSCPMHEQEQSPKVLMDDGLQRRVPVKRSGVAVRP